MFTTLSTIVYTLFYYIFSLYDSEFISLLSDSDDDDLDANFQEALQASLDQAADGSHVSSQTKYIMVDHKCAYLVPSIVFIGRSII